MCTKKWNKNYVAWFHVCDPRRQCKIFVPNVKDDVRHCKHKPEIWLQRCSIEVCFPIPIPAWKSTDAWKTSSNEEGNLETPNGDWGPSYLQMTRFVLKFHSAILCVTLSFCMSHTHRTAIHFHIIRDPIGHTIYFLICAALLATTAALAAVTALILTESDGWTWAQVCNKMLPSPRLVPRFKFTKYWAINFLTTSKY